MKKVGLLCTLFLLTAQAWTQDHEWWSQNVGWDGVSHWREYLISAPKFLGPNALPMPELGTGQVFRESDIRLSGNSHWAPGDRTWNPAIYVHFAAWPGRIGFDLYWVPVEYFTTSHEWKTERRVFHLAYNDQWAGGDVLMNTTIRVFAEEEGRPGVALRIGYRFPASNNIGAARFTDSPGFHFDLSAGKDFPISNGVVRASAMVGLLIWQTNTDTHLQNDAALFGVGVAYQNGPWTFSTSFRGYLGYLNNGDRPLMLDLAGQHDWEQWGIFVRFQEGWKDNLYRRLELGGRYRLDWSMR